MLFLAIFNLLCIGSNYCVSKVNAEFSAAFDNNQNKNFLFGILATVARVASKANISSAETTFPLRFNNSMFDTLKASANYCNSSIINKLFERSRSLRLESLFIASVNLSDTSEESLLFET